MALAYLLNQIPQIDPSLRIKPVALIVNHNARPGSDSEASFVAKQLQKHGRVMKLNQVGFTDAALDIESHVLHMRWKAGFDPLKSTRFEMLARSNRYQLIAQAALQSRIRHLFLGHHLDDQVETIMIRLLRNTNITILGLKGMAERSSIPCCDHIRGAHESIEFRSAEEYMSHDEDLQSSQRRWSKGINHGRHVGVSNAQGLLLHRPLLQFSKSQLVKTCQEHNIEYVTDMTNFDPTLTMRNAVRHMRGNYKLPRALQTKSMLQLMATAQQHSQSLERRGEELLSDVRVVEFDLRIGSMEIKFPPHFASRCEADMEAAAYALSRLMSVTSPQSREARVTLAPEARVKEFVTSLSSNNNTSSHQIDQTSIQRLPDKPYFQPGESLWKLYRPPMRQNEQAAAIVRFKASSDESVNDDSGFWSKWLLWDHRYWIRVKAQSAEQIPSITIRNFRPMMDNKYVRIGVYNPKNFRASCKQFAPGKMIESIPVLTWEGNIAAFPTLNVRVHERTPTGYEPQQAEDRYPIIEWEVCYKSLNQSFIQDQKNTIIWRNT